MDLYIQQYGDYVIQNMQSHHAEHLEELQKIVFPTLDDDEIFHTAQYLQHLKIFPQGQFVVIYNNDVIAASTTMRYNYNAINPYHKFIDIIGGGWLTFHNDEGSWLYGLDVSVHPQHRGKGLARIIYRARHFLVEKLFLKGQVIVGMMSGYGALKNTMSAEDYFLKIKNKEIFDPTVGVQMKMGFKPIVLMPQYIQDPICDNYGVLMTIDREQEI